MLTSKQVLEKTGISRATLHNYIALGILPKPVVKNPGLKGRGARQLGYFPKGVIAIIEQVNQLKKRGLSMLEISKKLAGAHKKPIALEGAEGNALQSDTTIDSTFKEATAVTPRPSGGLHLTIDQIPHAAYMVNYNFEVTWCNDEARQHFLSGFAQAPSNIEARNVFQFLARNGHSRQIVSSNEALRFHIALAKARVSKNGFASMVANLPQEKRAILETIYSEVDMMPAQSVLNTPITIADEKGEGTSQTFYLYASFYREGILFVYVPGGPASDSLLELLARRDDVIRKLLRKRLPAITQLAVMVTDLQDSVKICSELPAHEYFELINQIWATMGPIFRKYYGIHGKHVGDGMVYYFFPQPESSYIYSALLCAQEVKFAMRQLSKQWQLRKGWQNELYLNTALNEGQEWLGTFQASTNVEFTVLGDTINHASHLSGLARCGGIWATKNFISQLTSEERKRVRFGIQRKNEEGRNVFVASTYTQAAELAGNDVDGYEKIRDIGALPVTEILEVANLMH